MDCIQCAVDAAFQSMSNEQQSLQYCNSYLSVDPELLPIAIDATTKSRSQGEALDQPHCLFSRGVQAFTYLPVQCL